VTGCEKVSRLALVDFDVSFAAVPVGAVVLVDQEPEPRSTARSTVQEVLPVMASSRSPTPERAVPSNSVADWKWASSTADSSELRH
jgi:hypothetical protein